MKLVALLLACSFLPAQAASRPQQPLVATHYFYWYRWPDEHFRSGPGTEGHFHHFPTPKEVSYADPRWHEAQFTAMAACGIDIALPVYWGAPGAYELGHVRFSRAGLAPMVEALSRLEGRGAPRVQLGLFYDTTTLLCDVRNAPPPGGKPDLRTEEGKGLFCQTIVEYFEPIPPRFWARLDGRVLVVLYASAFARAWDRNLLPNLRKAFARRFPGEKLFLVADRSWGAIGQDRTTRWGAAIDGPRIFAGPARRGRRHFHGVAQIGPGFDDSPVPGRHGPVRDREGGNFYRWSWHKAIASRPELVLLETWNEMHEGSEICATRETGRFYLDLTREYTERLRKGDPGPAIPLRFRHPRFRPIPSAASAVQLARGEAPVHEVYADYTTAVPKRVGLREVPWADGPIRVYAGSLRPHRARLGGTCVYFQIADAFRFDVDEDLRVLVDLEPNTARDITLEYDARAGREESGSRYLKVQSVAAPSVRNTQRLVFELPRARCANRQNGGADFRLRIKEVRTVIRRVSVRISGRAGRNSR